MAVETQYNVVKVNELREITFAQGLDEIVINDIDSNPLETKKITTENFALSIKDYILPIATEDTLGGIIVGDGLTINPITGVLSNDIQELTDLSDVQILNAASGQVLRYNGNQWVNQSEGGIIEIIAGNGLVGGGSEGLITLHVNVGAGLSIQNNFINVNVRKGITINDDYLEVLLNPGLVISGNAITINAGQGLAVESGFLVAKLDKGLKYYGQAFGADISNGLEFNNNAIQVAITDNLKFTDGKLDVTPMQFANSSETQAFSINNKAVTPHGLGTTLGIANGIAPLDPDTLLDLDYLPKIPANKLKTVPEAWEVGRLNWDKSSNFTFTHNTTSGKVELGAVILNGYEGDSGFIFVTNATSDKLTGINNASWKPAVYTWYNVDNQEDGIETDVLISYYIANSSTIIYTASGVA